MRANVLACGVEVVAVALGAYDVEVKTWKIDVKEMGGEDVFLTCVLIRYG